MSFETFFFPFTPWTGDKKNLYSSFAIASLASVQTDEGGKKNFCISFPISHAFMSHIYQESHKQSKQSTLKSSNPRARHITRNLKCKFIQLWNRTEHFMMVHDKVYFRSVELYLQDVQAHFRSSQTLNTMMNDCATSSEH